MKRKGLWARTRPYRHPYVMIWMLFLMAFPYYLFPKGNPQLHDFMLLFLMITVMTRKRIRVDPAVRRTAKVLGYFVIYVTVVNVVWTMALLGEPLQSKTGSLIFPMYYIFNFLIFNFFGTMFARFGRVMLRATTYATFFSVVTLCVTSLPVMQVGVRNALYFENPNQLGYYTLLYSCLFAVGLRATKVWLPIQIGHFMLTLYLCAASLSKAAMASTVVLMAMTLVRKPIVLIGLLIAFAGVFAVSEADDIMSESIETRVATAGKGDDTAEGRGYDRIWKHPQHLILGAGEGEYWRFDSFIRGEIHSSLGTIVFCYGIPGFLFFLYFVATWVRRAGFESALLLVPLAMYSVTHMGLRFTPFWTLLAFSLCVRVQVKKNEKAAKLRIEPEQYDALMRAVRARLKAQLRSAAGSSPQS